MDDTQTDDVSQNPAEKAQQWKAQGGNPATWLLHNNAIMRRELPNEWSKRVFDELVRLFPSPQPF